MIDSHFHIWRLQRGDYGWLTPDLKPIYRDVSPDDWWHQAQPCGVTRGILVQAAPTEAETEFLLAQAGLHPGMIAGVVGWTDLEAANAPDRIAMLAGRPLLLGLRPMLHDLPDPAWILGRSLGAALDAMTASNLTFDALIRPVHLPFILALAGKHPNLRIVIDHGAKPAIAANSFEPWVQDIARIARETSAFCKLSGLLTEAERGVGQAVLHRYVAHLLNEFGPKRLLWGSDWPVLELAASYHQWHEMARSLVPAEFHQDIFDNTARAAYPRIA